MTKFARGSVIDVDARGRARMLARERYDRDQMALVVAGDDREARKERNKRRVRELTGPLLESVDAVVDVIDELGRFLVKIPAPVLVGGVLYWLGPSALGGAVGGAVARRRRASSGRRRG